MSERRKSPVEQEQMEPEMCSVDLRLEILGRVPFFSQLSSDDILEINRLFREEGYTPDEPVYFEGDPARRLYVVAAGRIKLLRHTSAGKDVLLDILTPGDFFGSLSSFGNQQYQESAIAQTACCVLGIGAEDFRKILERHPTVTLKVLDEMTARLNAAHEMVRQLSAYSIEQRLAYILLKLGEKLGEESEEGLLIQVPLSRDDLAQMGGMTTESASRTISAFQRDGLVHTGRQWVAIADREGLQEVLQGEFS